MGNSKVNKKQGTKFSRWLDKMDEKAANKGKKIKLVWQIVKFLIVSLLVTIIQLALVNLLFFCMKGWVEPLPGFLGDIFTEEVMGKDHSNWGYILPFFLSNLIANTVGYFLNKHKTFKSEAPWWHYVIYIVFLFLLIVFTTWIQGLVANLFIARGVESLGPTVAAMAAGTIQMLLLFPLQKFVLLREKHCKSCIIFKKFEINDAEAMFNNWASDPEVTQYMTWNAHENIEITKMIINSWIEEYKDPKTYRFVIVLKKTKELIGSIDVVKYRDGVPEIGYCLSRKYRNQGIMTEALKMFIDLLHKEGFAKIIIEADERNIGSNRVIEKCGFTFVKKESRPCSQFKPEIVVVNWYELEKNQK